MSFVPPYQVPYERMMAFIAGPRFADDLATARDDYFRRAGDVSEEHRSYEMRVLAFLDWYAFDRPLPESDKPPVLKLAEDESLPDVDREALRSLSRTLHSLFELRKFRGETIVVRDVLTGTDHTVLVPQPIPGLEKGDLVDTRLVPWAGELHFSPAFLLHPRPVRRHILKGVKKLAKSGAATGQELVWVVSRMAARAEYYRSMPVERIYDFDNPPPISREARIRCDPASVAARRWGKVEPLPIPEDEPTGTE